MSRAAWIVAGLVVCLVFWVPMFVGLGLTDMQNDEAIYSFGADVMAASGDWLTPRSSPSETLPFLEKPPLKFWIVAAPIALGLLPDNEFGLRFWDALFGSFAFLYVFAIGRRIGGATCGVLSVLMLFVHRPLVFDHGLRSNNMEAALVLAYSAAIYHFLAWSASRDESRSRRHVYAVALCFVLAFMTKFVAALFLPAILATVLLMRRSDRARFVRTWRTWLAAATGVLLVTAPWFVYEYIRFGDAFVESLFGSTVYTRFTSFVDPAHVQPLNYYVVETWNQLTASQTLLWTLGGLANICWRSLRPVRSDELTILLWCALPVGLISLGTSKLYHYAYPFLPPLALAAGYLASLAVGAVVSVLGWLSRWLRSSLPPKAASTLDLHATRRLVWLVGAASCLIALPALLLGPVKLALWGGVVLRASTPLRGLVVLVPAVILSRRHGVLALAAAVMVLAPMLPFDAYQRTISLVSVEQHPLRSLRDCLQRVSAGHVDPTGRPPIYFEEGTASHQAAFYLRTLGRWSPERTSDDLVYTSISTHPRPVLLSAARFGALNVGERLKNVPAVPVLGQVMLLPGPFAACAVDNGRSPWR